MGLNLNFRIAVLSVLLLSGMKCDKDQTGIEALPDITQDGRNTFGCLIDGEVFEPKGSGTNLVFDVQHINDDFFIYALYNGKGSMTLTLSEINSNIVLKCVRYNEYGGCVYQFCPPSNNNLIISKFDNGSKILSGQFNFNLPLNGACKELKITEGRFDVKF